MKKTNRFIFAFVTTAMMFAASLAAAAPIPIAGARLLPSKTAEGIRWDARYIVDLDASNHFEGGTIELAAPLPESERPLIEPSPYITAVIDKNHRITGIQVAPEALRGRSIEASFITTGFSAPIAQGSSVQIIEPPERMMIDVDPMHGFEKHVGYVAPRSISHSAREEARRLTDTSIKLTKNLTYVRGDDIRPETGFKAKLVDQKERTRSGSIGIGILFIGVVGSLIFAAKRLTHSASVERADRILKAEIDGLKKRRV
jgi:hypothetical protein